jgi:hypothetical protein
MWCIAALVMLALISHTKELPDLLGLESTGPPPRKTVYNTALNVIMIAVAIKRPVLYDWTEKTAWLLGNLVMVGVYFYNGYRPDRQADAAE